MKTFIRVTCCWFLLLLHLAVAVSAQTATGFSVTASTVGPGRVIELQDSNFPANNCKTFQIKNGVGGDCAACSAPVNGTITQFTPGNGTLIYTPTSGYLGADTFTFTVTATPIVSGACSGTPVVSAQAAVTINVTNAKTKIRDVLLDAGGNPRQGTITFFPTQQSVSGDGLVPAWSSVSAVLDGSGRFTVQVFPSRSLNPQVYYQVRFKDKTTGKEEPIGVYDIPATTTEIVLMPYKVTDANLAARYLFKSVASPDTPAAPKVTVSNNGSFVGTQPEINFIASSPVTQTISNNTGANRIDVTLMCPTCTGGGGGGSGVVGPGTVNKYAIFTGATTVGDGLFSQAGNVVSLPGHLDITQQTNSTTPLTVRAAGAPTVPLARFLDSTSTERFQVSFEGVPQLSGFTALPGAAGVNQAKLAYYTGAGVFTQQLMLAKNGSSSWGPVVRVNPSTAVTVDYLPRWSAVGDLSNSIVSQIGTTFINVAGGVQAGSTGYTTTSNAGFARFRATNTFDGIGGLYNIQQAIVEAELGLTNGLLLNTQESGAPVIVGVFGSERGRFTSTGLTVTSSTPNSSGLKFANLTSASPATAETTYLGLNATGDVVIAATPSGGGGGGAPTGATYLTFSLDGTLTNERALGPGPGLTETDGGVNGLYSLNLDTAYAPTWSALHTFNRGTTPSDAIFFDIAALGSPGTRSSHNFVQRSRARDGSGSYSADWRTNVEAIDQAGSSRWRLQWRRDGGTFANQIVVEDSGSLRVYGRLSTGSGNIFLTDTTGNLQLTAFASGARTGNGAKIVTGTGTYTVGNCLNIDANGNAVDSGAACGGGGGSSAWNAITNPSNNQALTMAAFTTTWTYNNATSTNNLFTLTDTASNSGTGLLARFMTASASTLKPFSVEPRGQRTLYVDHLGNVVAGVASRSTTDTDGWLYLPAVAGLNVNVPTAHGSFAPVYVDTTNGVLRAHYSSNWNALGLDKAADKVFLLTGGATLSSVPDAPAQITADQNNYQAGTGRSLFYRLTSDASRTLTGFNPAGGTNQNGELHYFINVGANSIVLAHESASSTAANRFTNATGANITLAANEMALLVYDNTSSRWRVAKL